MNNFALNLKAGEGSRVTDVPEPAKNVINGLNVGDAYRDADSARRDAFGDAVVLFDTRDGVWYVVPGLTAHKLLRLGGRFREERAGFRAWNGPAEGEGVNKPTKTIDGYDYASTQFDLPASIALRVLDWGKANVPDGLLHEGERESNPHITVLYGLHTNDWRDVSRVVKDLAPVKVRLGKVSIFDQDDCDVVKIDVQSDALQAVNERLKALDLKRVSFGTWFPSDEEDSHEQTVEINGRDFTFYVEPQGSGGSRWRIRYEINGIPQRDELTVSGSDDRALDQAERWANKIEAEDHIGRWGSKAAEVIERLKALTVGEERLPGEIERLIVGYISRRSTGEIVRVEDISQLRSLTPFVTYEGDQVLATRKRVDQLDQVTVTWKRGVRGLIVDASPSAAPSLRSIQPVRSLPHTSSFPVYRPHITVAYVAKGSCGHLVGNTTFEGVELTLKDLTFSAKDGSAIVVRLGGDQSRAAEQFVQTLTTAVMQELRSVGALKVSFPAEEREVRETTLARDPRRLAKARRALDRARQDYEQQQRRIEEDRARRRKSLKGGTGTIPVRDAYQRFTDGGRPKRGYDLEYRGVSVEELVPKENGDFYLYATGRRIPVSADDELDYFISFRSLSLKAGRMTLDEFYRDYVRRGGEIQSGYTVFVEGDEVESVVQMQSGTYVVTFVGGMGRRFDGSEPVEVRRF
jgi:hypothetical protein